MFEFSVKEILPHVYHFHFSSGYDNAMHFLRFQEYYESSKFYRKIFSLVDYMEWYAEKHGEGSFTYASDWSGFNVPSWALIKVREADIPDLNKYDFRMFMFIDWIQRKEGDHPFYFIGTSSEENSDEESEESILNHEMAHALFTVNQEYRESAYQLMVDWGQDPGHKGEEFDSARDVLAGMGYHSSTISDEIHAYCATGLCKELKGVISKKEMKPFEKLFKEFKKRCKNEESK